MQTAPVIPVMVIENASDAVPLAHALVEGGLRVLEITLRSDAALQAIENIATNVPDAIVGVGTLCTAEQVKQSVDAGAVFGVSPGFTQAIGDACKTANLPLLPGVMTPADILMAIQNDLDALKFFPAAQAGGINSLKALSGPFPDIVFCPTGGIKPTDFQDYLALDNVLCVGGSWVCPKTLVQEKRWPEITQLAKDCHNHS